MHKIGNQSDKYAVFFDLDGTLIDSETITEKVVLHWLKTNHGITPDIHLKSLHGITWLSIAKKIYSPVIQKSPETIAIELEKEYYIVSNSIRPRMLLGAHRAFCEAALNGCTAIVTGSSKRSVMKFLTQEQLVNQCSFYVSCENYSESKPHPAPYILAAELANCKPKNCLVFEDSIAGVTSAANAGMNVVTLLSKETIQQTRAHLSINNYDELPSNFFSDWFEGRLSL